MSAEHSENRILEVKEYIEAPLVFLGFEIGVGFFIISQKKRSPLPLHEMYKNDQITSKEEFLSSKNDNFKNGAQKINNDNNTSYFMTTLFIICNYI